MLSKSLLLFDDLVRIAGGAQPHQLLRRMKLMAESCQQVHARIGFPLNQHRDIVSRYLDANALFQRNRAGLMRRLLQH